MIAPPPHLVYVTVPDTEEAERIAETVVGERLAACANIVPGIISIYRWEGRTERSREVILFLKSSAERVGALVARVIELHSYSVPCVVSWPLAGAANPAFLAWIMAETAG